ncbi:MAG TPA: helix-turn-helix domain-containing protein [Solirubrobacteraceae bacterium]|nr:helix-turn-helix domain-containing protein [Solirubrobacteraceae bacterium]
MEPTSRPYAVVPVDAAHVLRPALPGLADEMIAAIAREVPDYARAMEGEFGQVVRLGVEVALNRFVDLLADPEPDAAESRSTYVDLGRGEFRAGRSLDALLAAYRVGARLAWRRFVEAGVAGGLAPDAIYALGEAIFAYIDELSAESAEGYAEEQTAAAGESERRRRRLVRLLAQDPPAGQEAVRTAAAAATWTLPRGGLAALVAATAEDGAPGEAPLDSIAARLARRLGEGAIGAEAFGAALVFVPDPDAPGRRRRLEALIHDRPAALGPTVEWQHGSASARRAIATHRLAAAGKLARQGGAAGGLIDADDHLADLLLAADPRVAADLAASRLAPLAELAEGPRARMTETLAAWLDRPGQVQAVAAALDVHPQTVRYRVRQLRDLFGERLEDPDARFELSLALRCYQ